MNWNNIIARPAFFLAICVFGSAGAFAQELEVNIMTGGATGTYIQIGKDIAALAEQAGRENVIVVESAGSMENIQAVRQRPRTQFGIVQSDVLDFIRTFRAEDAQMRSILRNTRIAFPLYKEEVQIVTTRATGINTLGDLTDRIVGVGSPNSGTNLTATFLFEIENVRPRNLVQISAGEALDQLRAGNIEAFVYVAGAPTPLLSGASAADNLKLVTIPGTVVGDYYGITTIRAGTYPWLLEDVTTAAVRAVLMTYEFDPSRNNYFKQSCEAVSEIAYLINNNIDELRQNGHPKWNQVDLEAFPSGWEQSACVKTALSQDYRPPYRGGGINVSLTADCSAIENPVAKRLCLMRQ